MHFTGFVCSFHILDHLSTSASSTDRLRLIKVYRTASTHRWCIEVTVIGIVIYTLKISWDTQLALHILFFFFSEFKNRKSKQTSREKWQKLKKPRPMPACSLICNIKWMSSFKWVCTVVTWVVWCKIWDLGGDQLYPSCRWPQVSLQTWRPL